MCKTLCNFFWTTLYITQWSDMTVSRRYLLNTVSVALSVCMQQLSFSCCAYHLVSLIIWQTFQQFWLSHCLVLSCAVAHTLIYIDWGVSAQVFLREQVKQCLDEELYHMLLLKVVVLQSWLRSRLQRRRYLLLRSAVLNLQVRKISLSVWSWYQDLLTHFHISTAQWSLMCVTTSSLYDWLCLLW